MPVLNTLMKIIIVLVISVLTAIGVYVYRNHSHRPMRSSSQTNTVKTLASHPNRIRLLAAGDFLAHDSINLNAKQPDGSYNYLPMMGNFSGIFHGADIRFCNDGNLNGGAAYGISGYPKFNSPKEFVRDMSRLGCNMVNTGTNHSFDRNQAAINASVDAWAAQPDMLAVAGENKNQQQHDNVHVFEVKGVKFAFLAYTTYLNTDAPAQDSYGVNVYSESYAARQIKQAKAMGAQIIIVSIRWGVEYSPVISTSQRQIAQFLADQGVSLILGHGSHVLEPVQKQTGKGGNNTIVWYSLGNFINTQLPADTLFNGLGVIDYDITSRQITDMSFLPLYMHYEWTAAQAKAQSPSDLLARHDIKMYLLENTTQQMIDAQQLDTTVQLQRQRLQSTLDSYLKIPLVSLAQYSQ